MNPWLAAAIIIIPVCVMAALMLLVRRHAPPGGRFSDSDRASGPFGFVGAGFVILLGFIIALSFGTYDNAATQSEAEATAIEAQFTAADAMPPMLRKRAQAQLVCYARSVAGPEWTSMADGNWSPLTDQWISNLDATEAAASAVKGTAAANALTEWHDAAKTRELARRTRILVAQGEEPVLLWVLLAIGGIMVLGYVLLYADPDERVVAQLAMVVSTTALVAASLVAVTVLASPFQNEEGSIKPTGVQYSLRVINADLAAAHTTLPVLCDANGNPVR